MSKTAYKADNIAGALYQRDVETKGSLMDGVFGVTTARSWDTQGSEMLSGYY